MSFFASVRRLARAEGGPPRSQAGALARMAQLSVVAGVGVALMAVPATAFVAYTANDVSHDMIDLPLELEDLPNAQTTVVLASNGERLAYFYQENRQDIPLKDIAPVMQKSLLAIEDARFYEHGPLDLKGTLRALVNNAADGYTQGGSTITQQLVKLTLVSQATTKEQRIAAIEKSKARKLRELKLAIKYEQQHSKNEILERYLNLAYFGDGAWGVNSAAFHYFSTSPDKLTPKQAATLAGLVKNPDEFNPVAFPEKALQRRNIVLSVMARDGIISQAEAEKLQAEGLGLKITKYPNGCVESFASFSCDYIRQYLLDEPALGATVAERKAALERGGLTVESNIDVRMQKAANKAVKNHVDPTDKAIGSIAMVEPGTGKVRGVAQSRPMGKTKGKTYLNFSVPTQYGQSNGFQAGSTFKMFTVAAALKKGLSVSKSYKSPNHLTMPPGTYFDCEGRGTGKWEVGNSTGAGTFNMYTGTRQSVNTYFAQLEKDAGLCNTVKAAEAMGITVPYDPDKKITQQVPSFTLGVVDVSPLEMAAAYATPASGGEYCAPQPVNRILDRKGDVLKKYEPECTRVMSKGIAAQINDILAGLQRPGGFGYARGTGLPIESAAKTGTTNSNKSVWYVGYTPELSTAAMLAGASKDGRPIPINGEKVNGRIVTFNEAAGSALAGPMWKAAMGPISAFLTPAKFDAPPERQPVAQKKKSKSGDDDDDAQPGNGGPGNGGGNGGGGH